MIKIKNNLFPLQEWEMLDNKYCMKYKHNYQDIENEFIQDLLKLKRFEIYVDNVLLQDYIQYKYFVKTNKISKRENKQLKQIFKYVYLNEINDYSEYGIASELIILK